MPSLVHYLPIATTLFSAAFAWILLQRWRAKGRGAHLLWWAAGAAAYGVGTLMESATTLFGWTEWTFKAWYVAGALFGGFPLAQGTVYLLLRRRTAHVLTAIVLPFALVASVFVLLSPVDHALVEPHRLTGKVLEWSWVRLFSPFVNLYALVFLVGGAALSAWRFRARTSTRHRMVGNVLIAVGGLLPGIGGAFTRFGHTEVLYVTELVGILLIYAGYREATRESPTPHAGAPAAATDGMDAR